MDKKQIVFLLTDTTRYDMLGCYGNPDMKTPHLDALASSGMRFEKAYCCQPVCTPARSAIFSGMYPHTNGAIANCLPMYADVQSIGDYLQEQGTHATYIGKWHLDGGDYFGTGRCPDGYDEAYWYDMRRYLEELSEEERVLSRKESTAGTVPSSFTFAHRCTERAVDFLAKHGEEDFFLCVSYDEPHHPYISPEPYASMYQGYEFPKSPNVWDNLEGKPLYQKLWAGDRLHEDKDALRIMPSRYLGCNSYVDAKIGEVLDAVYTYAPSALIVFTSDHGEALYSHSLTQKGAAVYDEIARVPLIISGGPVSVKSVYPHVASHIDLFPTFLDYFGIPLPLGLQGKSMLKVLDNPTASYRDEAFIEFTRYEVDHDGFGGLQMMRSIITDRYKLAIHLLDSVDELYDTALDPAELENRIYDKGYTEIRDQLFKKLMDFMNETRDPYRGYQWRMRPWNSLYVPSWDVDGYTRQKAETTAQLDYDTGLPIKEAVRPKKKQTAIT